MNKFFFKLFLLFSANILFSFNNNNSLSSSNTYTISVSASGSSSYTLSGNDRNGSVSGDDPDLTFNVGDVVTFSVNASGHPFYLKTVAGTGTGNQIDVSNNGTTSGDIVWTPSAKGTFFYQCSLHSGMVGTITIKDPQIWKGDNITFTKGDQSDPTLQANQDRITDNVWITRANKTQDGSNGYGQIFNIKEETKPDVNNSPLGTKWTVGTIDQIESLTFKKFRAAVGKPKNVPGKNLVVYLEKDDIYLSLKFSSWSQGQKGGFSYERSTQAITNNTPVATAQSVTTQEDTAKEITHVGTDADEDTLSFIIVTLPTNGTLKDGDTQISSEDLPKTLSSAKVTYTPNSDYNGDDSYTFKVNDGTEDSSSATISITVTSNDLDDDGVKNPLDKCPDTPAGAQVDFDGCQVFSLPTDNNKVSVTSATCIGTSDGSIGLSVEDASYDYTITVTNNDNVTITGDSKTGSVTGLAAGTYTVCFKVDSQASYEQCFDVVIGEPAALTAYLDIDNDNRTTSIQLGGSSSYNIDINGTKYDVSGDSFIATLPTGLSIIKISTDLDCQGVIEREVFLSEDILYYPNPTQDDVNVHVDGQDTKVTVSVFSEKGSLLYREEQEIKDMSRLTQIDLSKQITGTYIVVMEGTTVRKTFKIVKR